MKQKEGSSPAQSAEEAVNSEFLFELKGFLSAMGVFPELWQYLSKERWLYFCDKLNEMGLASPEPSEREDVSTFSQNNDTSAQRVQNVNISEREGKVEDEDADEEIDHKFINYERGEMGIDIWIGDNPRINLIDCYELSRLVRQLQLIDKKIWEEPF